MRTIISGDLIYVWNGGHTCNIYKETKEVDCFTFGWEKDQPSENDFLIALAERWTYENCEA